MNPGVTATTPPATSLGAAKAAKKGRSQGRSFSQVNFGAAFLVQNNSLPFMNYIVIVDILFTDIHVNHMMLIR